MSCVETPLVFECAGEQLVGVLHNGSPTSNTGVLIVVGGPQYRVGSHREFVLVARRLAAHGIPVFRFDTRGMGDSSGRFPGFEAMDADIRMAVSEFLKRLPQLDTVVLLGLCDGASASLMYACEDDRIRGLILWNPWIRNPSEQGGNPVKHYYLRRFGRRSNWRMVLSERNKLAKAIWGLAKSVGGSLCRLPIATSGNQPKTPDFVARMRSGIERFDGPVLLLISGNDLVGTEFLEHLNASEEWNKTKEKQQVKLIEFRGANHTMTARSDLNSAADACLDWLTEKYH